VFSIGAAKDKQGLMVSDTFLGSGALPVVL
jgi:hypothetical protein